jgi:N-acetylated-alpha-linked acidic dipeptidase
LWSVLTWLLADSLVVPFDIIGYATFLRDSVNSIRTRYEKGVKAQGLSLLQLENVIQNFTSAAKEFQNKILHLDKSEYVFILSHILSLVE